MTVLIINGPNLNMLGVRDKNHYGTKTLDEINKMLQNKAKSFKAVVSLEFFQSNHEGDLIDFIQKNHKANGIIINPGALSHYSHALADALRDFKGKKVEVHLSDIKNREKFRKKTVTAEACDTIIIAKKEKGYLEALERIVTNIK